MNLEANVRLSFKGDCELSPMRFSGPARRLAVNGRQQVIDIQGKVIPGLFAGDEAVRPPACEVGAARHSLADRPKDPSTRNAAFP